MNIQIKILFLLLMAFLFFACNKDENQARKSIEGDWEVTAINSTYGEFVNNGFDPDTTIEEIGELGTFISVSYTHLTLPTKA